MSITRQPVLPDLFAETADGPRLLGSKCTGCGTPYFPASPVCHNPRCVAPALESAAFGPHGTLWSFAVQYYAPPPPVKFDEPFQPFAIGVIDLPEGLRVLGRLSIDDLRKITIGMPVELVIDRLAGAQDGSELTTWKFRPAGVV